MFSFFSFRQEGVNTSSPDVAWRYGAGNVFLPDSFLIEHNNALANTSLLLGTHMPSRTRSVMLASQYGKGIQVIDEGFLSHADASGDPIVFNGDGLFTVLPQVALLNKSGDAHAVTFESPTASAVLVGSWRCIKEGIFESMIQKFVERGIDLSSITIRVGPGLGADSYSVGEEVYSKLLEMRGVDETVFRKKEFKPGKPQKYVLNFPELIRQAAHSFGITAVDTSASDNTFDKTAWKAVKTTTNPDELKAYYASMRYFSARLFTRVTRQIDRVIKATGAPLPPGVKSPSESTYADTGRCLNGVMLPAVPEDGGATATTSCTP